jgi:hypothetical protein
VSAACTKIVLCKYWEAHSHEAKARWDARLARWLLETADRVGGEKLALTQELLAEMLGVRRTTVTLFAHALQARGIIKYSRGKIAIVDRKALQASARDCYDVTAELYRQLSAGPEEAAITQGRSPPDLARSNA